MHPDKHPHLWPDPRHPAGLLDPEFDTELDALRHQFDGLRDLSTINEGDRP